jgi:hypothetical protein
LNRVFIEDWAASYGSPYLVPVEQEAADAELIEDGACLESHRGVAAPGTRVAFVDGVRRADAWLYTEDELTGMAGRAIAGTHACGAVVLGEDGRAAFADAIVQRLAIWGNGISASLPPVPGGWTWTTASIADASPDAPLVELQNRMRQAEGRLAEDLAGRDLVVVVDGPLNFIRSRDLPVTGYVKTHHRALLQPEIHRLIPGLETGCRTSIFRLGEDRYSFYLRLADTGPDANPWSGIVRLEIPQSAGLTDATRIATWLAGELPRFAGVRHRDPRAPQNLQPIGALETHLRHLMGHAGLTSRAVREAVAALARGN